MATPYDSWIGRAESVEDVIALAPARAMLATLDDNETRLGLGDALPPMWHWLYFHSYAPQSAIGPDGHPARGSFMPPVELPRRMFAGARLRFPGALRLGERAEKTATITAISEKQGESGKLVFVAVTNRFSQGGKVCVEEDMDIVYRAAGGTTPAPKALAREAMKPVPPGAWSREVAPDPVLLFRYSALTFNGHRIHYDRAYAMGEEGYPGLVVHGPLTATYLAELPRRNSRRPIAGFSFRARGPLFDGQPFRVQGTPKGDTVALEAIGPDGQQAMTGEVTLA